MKNLSRERVQAGQMAKFSQFPGILGLPSVLDKAAVHVWYEHTLPPVEQKESKGKRLQQNCLKLCCSNRKEITSSFYVNPSLRKKAYDKSSYLSDSPEKSQELLQNCSETGLIMTQSCTFPDYSVLVLEWNQTLRTQSASLLGLHGKLAMTRRAIINHY